MGKPSGALLMPGAGGTADHATLIALADALEPLPVARHEFAYRRAGRKAPPRAPKLVAELREDLPAIAAGLGVTPDAMVIGGRSMGGRVCSMAVAEGLPAAGLVLLSYPLHPPGKPDTLRTEHFGDIDVPVLFVSGSKDPFGSPDDFAAHVGAIAGPVTSVFLDGGAHDPSSRAHRAAIVEAVTGWVTDL